jgi:dTDP-4-amino-4,6-dideoxygalactose transaminase
MEPKYYHHEIGGNFRLDEIQAAVLRVKAPYLERWNEARRANAARYARLFLAAGVPPAVILPTEPEGYRHVYHQYVIRTPRRDDLRQHLSAAGIGCEIYYPVPLHQQSCFAGLGHGAGEFPVAEATSKHVLALPIYAELSEEQQQAVVQAIGSFFL